MRLPLASMVALLIATDSNAAAPTYQDSDSCVDPSASASQKASSDDGSSPLEVARGLRAPLASDTLDAEFEHASFWDDNGPLLREAWREWEARLASGRSEIGEFASDGEFLNPVLSVALNDAFDHPSEETESAVKAIWTSGTDEEEPLPKGVYATQLLSPEGISRIRSLLDGATSSGIPTRRPNGMNRHGVIIDSDVHGAVSMESLVRLVEEEIIDRVVRPVGRMLFPDRVGCEDDIEYFAFTIKYDGSDEDDSNGGSDKSEDAVDDGGGDASSERDVELKEHRDASVITLNVNLNLPEEGFTGSEVYFREYPTGESSTKAADDERDLSSNDGNADGGTVRFAPGMAVVHLGAHRHGSLPISASEKRSGGGKRYNLVIWLFGRDGDVRIAPYEEEERMGVAERWRGCNRTQGFAFG